MVVAALLGVVVLVGCTSTSAGRAEPAPTGSSDSETSATAPESSSPGAEPLPSDGAPKVENPLDTTKFQQDPCLALTAAQARELNVGAQGKPVPAPLGKGCDWRNSETGGHIYLQWAEKDPRGLSAEYKANKAGTWAYFVELPKIEGYPAVARDISDRRDKGECLVAVGVSDKVSFQLGGTLSRANIGKKDACEVTVQVAGMMLRTMKAGG